jgi:hypothetical protein
MRSEVTHARCNACEKSQLRPASSTNVFFCPLSGFRMACGNAACSSKMACTQQTIFMELGLTSCLNYLPFILDDIRDSLQTVTTNR